MAFLKKFFHPPARNFTAFGRTDTGKIRAHNEDSFCLLEKHRLFLVADGMGGHNAGEVASRVAVEALVEFFTPAKLKQMTGNQQESRHCMIKALHSANKKVMTMAADNEAMRGMGCTLVACRLDGDILHTCHVGDARCYIADDERITQLTTDHAGVAYSGQTQEGEGPGLHSRNIITMAIGFPFQRDPEYHQTILQPDDKILLCSDGLWSMVNDREIHHILKTASSPETASDTLIQRANDAGGRDNITAVVIFRHP